MKIKLVFVTSVLLIAFVVLQFFQPPKNDSPLGSNHIYNQEKVSDEIKEILTTACMDCHSNSTRYSWYHKVSPVSLMVNKHVVEGKKELNFSDWETKDVFEKITIMEEICRESKRKTMPLKSYKALHPNSRLTEEQTNTLCTWANQLSQDLLVKAMEQ